MKKINISIVKGNEGYSLQLLDKDGSGTRAIGPKAWGNPYNTPTCEFKNVDVEEFIKELLSNSYEELESNKEDALDV